MYSKFSSVQFMSLRSPNTKGTKKCMACQRAGSVREHRWPNRRVRRQGADATVLHGVLILLLLLFGLKFMRDTFIVQLLLLIMLTTKN